MTEKLLHFIWQFQYFNKQQLTTEQGERLQIIFPGTYNHHQGQDFLQAKIKIDEVILAGNIELHVQASDWLKHGHTTDKHYQNSILHVVWQHDKDIFLHQKPIPTLSLASRVPKVLLEKYQQLMQTLQPIPCQQQLPALSALAWTAYKERLATERLQAKTAHVLQLLQQSNNHWEEVFWWMLASNFGIKVNAAAFQAMAQTISINILAKHKNQIHQLEALLLGQANLLQGNFEEDYPNMLQREYKLYKSKYKLNNTNIWPLFLRMRPAAFPTVRLAQLAMLIHQSSHLFAKIKDINNLQYVKQLLNVTANDYWHYHYKFDETAAYKPKHLGEQMVHNLLINTIVPVLFAYGHFNQQIAYKAKALDWLQQIPAEQNSVLKHWNNYVAHEHALDSQALIHLTKMYCTQKKCLDCAVGVKLLKQPHEAH